VINCRRADLDRKTPQELNKNYYLCAEHFEPNQFTNDLQNWLTWKAIPTLFKVRLSTLLFLTYFPYFQTTHISLHKICKTSRVIPQIFVFAAHIQVHFSHSLPSEICTDCCCMFVIILMFDQFRWQ
jgi:hypothetical protein